MPQVDDCDRQDDHKSRRGFVHQLCCHKLRRACEHDRRHHLRRGFIQTSIQRQRAIDHAEWKYAHQQWEFSFHTSPKGFYLFVHNPKPIAILKSISLLIVISGGKPPDSRVKTLMINQDESMLAAAR